MMKKTSEGKMMEKTSEGKMMEKTSEGKVMEKSSEGDSNAIPAATRSQFELPTEPKAREAAKVAWRRKGAVFPSENISVLILDGLGYGGIGYYAKGLYQSLVGFFGDKVVKLKNLKDIDNFTAELEQTSLVILPEMYKDSEYVGTREGLLKLLTLQSYVRFGGKVVFTADGHTNGQHPCCLTTEDGTVHNIFGVLWRVTAYHRSEFEITKNGQRFFNGKPSISEFSIKGTLLDISTVPEEENLYDDGAYVSVACKRYHTGIVMYFSDVNWQKETAQIIADVARVKL